MINKNKTQLKIKKLQDNLLSIRRISGWTAQELGDKLGVSKQTISNLENKKVKMSQTQYIAIRTILDYEIETNKENKVLPQVISILLDSDTGDENDSVKNKEIEKTIKTIAATASGGVAGAALVLVATALLGPLDLAEGIPVADELVKKTGGWVQSLLSKKKTEKK